MPIFSTLELLHQVHFLRDLDAEHLTELVKDLVQEEYVAGEAIMLQGSRPEGLFIISIGEVELYRSEPEQPDRHVSTLEQGDFFGALELVYRQPRRLSARAASPTTVLRWDRESLTAFMKRHDSALEGLRFAASSQRLAEKKRFHWLREGEEIHGIARKHPAILIQLLSFPVILVAVAAFLGVLGLTEGMTLLIWLSIGIGIVGLGYGIWQVIDWTNDYYLVTDRRAIWLEKVIAIYDSRREAPLHTVLSVSVSTDITARMLDYGDIVIRTYTGQVVFRNVGDPHAFAAVVETLWDRARAKREDADRESLVDALNRRFDDEIQEPIEEEIRSDEEALEGEDRRGRWGFRLKFEDKNVITYRKHWAVLLKDVSLPSFMILFLIGSLGARIGGLLTLATLPTFFLATSLLLVPVCGWWLYKYVDWANDIYQVATDQIVDIYKKPLAREERKVAPLENILGTEVDRKGLVGILLNYGNVIANVGTAQFIFEDVYDPVSVQQDIVNAQEAFMQRRSERDRQHRQDEMVELLDIYHERYRTESPEDSEE